MPTARPEVPAVDAVPTARLDSPAVDVVPIPVMPARFPCGPSVPVPVPPWPFDGPDCRSTGIEDRHRVGHGRALEVHHQRGGRPAHQRRRIVKRRLQSELELIGHGVAQARIPPADVDPVGSWSQLEQHGLALIEEFALNRIARVVGHRELNSRWQVTSREQEIVISVLQHLKPKLVRQYSRAPILGSRSSHGRG